MQEIDLDDSIDHKMLDLPNFSLEIKKNSEKARVGFYISRRIKYERKEELEGTDSNLNK